MITMKTEEFRQSLISLINNCELPAVIVYFVLKDCVNEVAQGYQQALDQEKIQYMQNGINQVVNEKDSNNNDKTV